MTPPKDVIMCCDMEEAFNRRMVAVSVLGITEAKLCKTFGVSSLEDLVERLTAEGAGIKAKCLVVFKKTHSWLYRD